MLKKMYWFLITLLCVPIFFSSAVSAGPEKGITISAAMSLKSVFEEIGRRYEAAHKGTKIMLNFGASGDLMRQIEGGAPVDAFAPASKKEMDALEKKGLIVPGSRIDFASNKVVIVTSSRAGVPVKSFADLASKAIKRIALGNPRTVPAGRYGAEALQYYGLMPAIKDKLVFAENVRQVLDYVVRGEADAGIVYATDFKSRAGEVAAVATASPASHGPIVYSFATVKGTGNGAQVKEFVSLLASAEGREALNKYGFVTGLKKISTPAR